MIHRSELAWALRHRRLGLGLSFEAVARRTGLSPTQLKKMESSAPDACNPTLTTVLALTEAYGLAPEFWFRNARRPHRPLLTLDIQLEETRHAATTR